MKANQVVVIPVVPMVAICFCCVIRITLNNKEFKFHLCLQNCHVCVNICTYLVIIADIALVMPAIMLLENVTGNIDTSVDILQSVAEYVVAH